MARSSATWKPGVSGNPMGKMTLGERVAARTIAEAFRELADPVDIGRSLLALYSGIDPFAPKAEDNPDKLPVSSPVPIDMTHRMAALKMYLEYGYGKPLQGVVIDAQVRQQTTLREERHTVVELRELSRSSPEAREALRTIARAVLGQRPPEVRPDSRPIATAPVELEPSRPQATELEAVDPLEDDEAIGGEAGPEEEDALLDLHGEVVAELETGEKKVERHPGITL